MRLKDLLTCTIGIFLCTSCIKDEAPNAEADIENVYCPPIFFQERKSTTTYHSMKA